MKTTNASAITSPNVGSITDYVIIIGLFTTEIVLSFYSLLANHVLSRGFNSLSLLIMSCTSSIFFLIPFAAFYEKKTWSTHALTPFLIAQIFLAALAEVPIQSFMLIGMKMTSPAFSSAMPNLKPAIIFLIAACIKIEKFSISCKYCRTKIVGTVLCLSGAISISLLMSPLSLKQHWELGCFYLFLCNVFHACAMVLQTIVMISFPAPLSVGAMTLAIELVLSIVSKFAMDGTLELGVGSDVSVRFVVGMFVLCAVVGGASLGFMTWSVTKKGPVIVSIFTPVQTVCTSILSAYLLGQSFNVGCLLGMVFMFTGLYFVLWAKMKEDRDEGVHGLKSGTSNIEDPLLS